MRKIFTVFTFVLLFALVGCSKSKLSDEEKKFFDIFSEKLDSFKDPASLKIIKIYGSFDDGKVIGFTVSASNSFGGTTSQEYLLVLESFECDVPIKYYDTRFSPGEMFKSNDVINNKGNPVHEWYLWECFLKNATIDDVEYDISKINKELENYKKDKGWV